jgi:transposase
MSAIIPITRCESVSTLRKKLAHSKDADQKMRIRAIINIKKGAKRREVAKNVVISRTTLVSWVATYNEGGTDALKMSKGGRPEGNPKWDTNIFDALIKEIDKGEHYWSVPLMQQWIEEHYEKNVPESTVWYHLTALDYSYKSARPHPYKGDAEKQKAFKKGGLSHISSV